MPFQAAETELALPVEQDFDGDTEDEDEKQRILAALRATNWRIYGPRGAARLLGMGPGEAALSHAQAWVATTRETVAVRACAKGRGLTRSFSLSC